MSFNISFNGSRMANRWGRAIDNDKTLVARATTQAARESAVVLEKRLRADISNAGHFGQRWQRALTVTVLPQSGVDVHAKINVKLAIPYADIFEKGGTIHGKPLLWIPLSYTGFKGGPKDFPGGLFAVKARSGRPLLLSLQDKLPKFFGITGVSIPKKFHIKEISQSVADEYKARHKTLLKSLKNG